MPVPVHGIAPEHFFCTSARAPPRTILAVQVETEGPITDFQTHKKAGVSDVLHFSLRSSMVHPGVDAPIGLPCDRANGQLAQ